MKLNPISRFLVLLIFVQNSRLCVVMYPVSQQRQSRRLEPRYKSCYLYTLYIIHCYARYASFDF